MQPKHDNTFCWYPFHMLALKEWRQGQGIINAAPCCNSLRPETLDPLNIKQRLKTEKLTAEEIFHGETMSEIRQYMLEGKRHPACNTCWRIEDRAENNDAYSYRIMSSEPGRLQGYEINQERISDPQLQTIDFAFGENCNLRCRMCSPGLSNKLRLDYQYFYENKLDSAGINGFDYELEHDAIRKKAEELGIVLSKTVDEIDYDLKYSSTETVHWDGGKQWQNILDNIHNLKHIKATGGETLVSKPFEEFLDTAIERGVAKNIYLEFHTNGTKFTNSMIEKLLQFEALHLNFSIDSVGKNYEYIRYPMLFDKVDNSIRNLLQKTHGKLASCGIMPFIKNFSFNVVLTALNAHYMKDLHKYQETLYAEYGRWPEYCTFYVDLLWPENKFTNVQFLTPAIKKDLIAQYTEIQDSIDLHHGVQIDTAVNFLKEWCDYEPTEQDRLNMLREVTVFDMSRNQSYRDYLHPDIIEYLETPRG